MQIQPRNESEAKKQTLCDNCRTSLHDEKDKSRQYKATLMDNKEESREYDYCNEECLRQHLNSRAKKKKSKASLKEINLGNCKIFV